MSRIVIVDFNNFWSPSGGGVRRYHLQKMDFYRNREDALLVFAMPDSRTYTEIISDSLVIEHICAFRFPGNWEYRFLWKQNSLVPVLRKYSPDVIEVGSPYILPAAIAKAAKKLQKKPVLTGFWHADFPVTYVRRYFDKWGYPRLARIMEKIAFAYARCSFKNYEKIQVSSHEVLNRLIANGFKEQCLEWMPLGCDIEMFKPERRDESLTESLKDGNPKRPTLFFPHRFCDEKGLRLLLNAYPLISKMLGTEPAILFAGTGPDLPHVQKAEKLYSHIRYVGFVKTTEEMARYYASCEIGFALSGWETFGLSILESMASGNCLVGASTGAAGEHIRESGAGILLQEHTPEALSQAVLQLIQGDLPEMRQKARTYAEKFSWKACFERQLGMYTKNWRNI
jgi:alpha-1,6-mannosyltransferase